MLPRIIPIILIPDWSQPNAPKVNWNPNKKIGVQLIYRNIRSFLRPNKKSQILPKMSLNKLKTWHCYCWSLPFSWVVAPIKKGALFILKLSFALLVLQEFFQASIFTLLQLKKTGNLHSSTTLPVASHFDPYLSTTCKKYQDTWENSWGKRPTVSLFF